MGSESVGVSVWSFSCQLGFRLFSISSPGFVVIKSLALITTLYKCYGYLCRVVAIVHFGVCIQDRIVAGYNQEVNYFRCETGPKKKTFCQNDTKCSQMLKVCQLQAQFLQYVLDILAMFCFCPKSLTDLKYLHSWSNTYIPLKGWQDNIHPCLHADVILPIEVLDVT